METTWIRLGIALGIGLLIGTERERRRAEASSAQPAGIRTFTLVALLGGLAALIEGPVALALAGAAVVLLAVAAYFQSSPDDRGITTEIALLTAFLLGAFAQREPVLASGVAVVVTAVLAGRTRFHDFARRALTEDELRDALLLGAAALVVLPLAPDRPLGPWGTVNPRTVWRLAVLVMAISSAGYIAVRFLGARLGLPLAGLAGGFISSTATIGSMGGRSRAERALRRPATAAAVLSSVSTVVLLAIVLGATSPPVLRLLVPSLVLAGVVAVGYGAAFAIRSVRDEHDGGSTQRGRAFSLKAALLFSLTITAVMLLAAGVNAWLGSAGLVVAMAAAGLADAHAAAISAAALVAAGQIEPSAAVLPVLAALSTNTVSKSVAAFAGGGWRFALRVIPGLLLLLGAAWAGLLVLRWWRP